VLRLVCVEFYVFPLFLPLDDVSPLDAVLWLARNCGKCAEGYCGTRGVHVKLAFNARCHGWEYDSSLALEAFRTAIDERLKRVGVLHVDQVYQLAVDPTASFNAVEPANDCIELHVVVVILQ
jgi:hypothetical protein